MKVYLTNKAIEKLKSMYETQTPGSISMRKYKKDKDPISNVLNGIKLNNKQRITHKTGMSYSVYINKDRLKEVKSQLSCKIVDESNDIKEGGFLPLIGLILAGLGTAAGIATGVSKTVLDSKHNDAMLEEEKRKNDEIIKASRGEGCDVIKDNIKKVESDGMYLEPWKSGMSIGVKDFVNGSGLDDIGKKTLRSILKNLSSHFNIERVSSATKGDGLYLYNPQ